MKGPFYKQSPGERIYWSRRWYTTNNGQKFRTPLPYEFHYGEQTTGLPITAGRNAAWAQGVATFSSGPYAATMTRLHNRAYSAWVDKIKGSIQIGADIAEGRQTIDLINNVLRKLRNPLAAVKKAHRRMPYSNSNDPRPLLKDLGSGWTAFHFGVEPLIKELYELLELHEKLIVKKRQVTVHKTAVIQDVGAVNGDSRNDTYRCHVRISGWHQIVDKEIATLAALGLTDPASIAWEVTPWSFVVDWFYPVALYLQQFDALSGRSVTDSYSTWYVVGSINRVYTYPLILKTNPAHGKNINYAHVNFLRSVGVPAPVLQRGLNPWSTSIIRALTSIGLLTQLFKTR